MSTSQLETFRNLGGKKDKIKKKLEERRTGKKVVYCGVILQGTTSELISETIILNGEKTWVSWKIIARITGTKSN